MKKLIALITILFTTITAPNFSAADDTQPSYIESAVFILNIKNSAPENVDGTALATPCTGCAPVALKLNSSTRLYVNGTPAKFDDLGLKIDWVGSVFYMPSSNPVATELFLNTN